MTADPTAHAITRHDAPDGGACYIMSTEGGTYHERLVSIGENPVVTWMAAAADTCPALDGNGVWTCLSECGAQRRPGLLADAKKHAASCTGRAA